MPRRNLKKTYDEPKKVAESKNFASTRHSDGTSIAMRRGMSEDRANRAISNMRKALERKTQVTPGKWTTTTNK